MAQRAQGDAPAVAHHQDVAAHLAVEHAREGYPVPEVPAVAVEHEDGRPSCSELRPLKSVRGHRRAFIDGKARV